MHFRHIYATRLAVIPLLLAVLMLGIVIALPVAEKAEAVTAPVLIVSPTQAKVGSLVTVTGMGFAPNSAVKVEFGDIYGTAGSFVDVTPPNPIAPSPNPLATTSSSGIVPSQFTVPTKLGNNRTVTTGFYTIRMTDSAGNSASTRLIDAGPFGFISYFNVIPTIELSQSQGKAGDTITVTGQGFTASQNIMIHLTQPYTIPQAYVVSLGAWFERAPNYLYPGDPGAGRSSTPPADKMTVVTVTIDQSGKIPANTTFTVPDIGAGLYEVTALDIGTQGAPGAPGVTLLVPQMSWCAPAKANFNVGPPYVTLTPDSGKIGSTIEVSGTGFAASHTAIHIYLQVNEYPVPDLSLKPENTTAVSSGWIDVTPTTNIGGAAPQTDSTGSFTGNNSIRITILDTMGPRTKINATVGAQSIAVVLGITPSIQVIPDAGRGTVTVVGNGWPGTPSLAGMKVSRVVTILLGTTPVRSNPYPLLTSTSGGFTATIALPSNTPAMENVVVAISGEYRATASLTVVDPLGPQGPEGPEGPKGDSASPILPIVAIILSAIAIIAVALWFVLRPRS